MVKCEIDGCKNKVANVLWGLYANPKWDKELAKVDFNRAWKEALENRESKPAFLCNYHAKPYLASKGVKLQPISEYERLNL